MKGACQFPFCVVSVFLGSCNYAPVVIQLESVPPGDPNTP